MTLFGRYFYGPMERNEDNSLMEAALLAIWFRLEVTAAREGRF